MKTKYFYVHNLIILFVVLIIVFKILNNSGIIHGFNKQNNLKDNTNWHFSNTIFPSKSLYPLFLLEDSLVSNMLRDSSSWKNDRALSGYKYGAKKILVNQAIAEIKIGKEWKSDKQTLGKKFLRENTELALKVKHLDWCKHLSDSDFCEYVLPYRFNTEPVYPIRRQLYEHFIRLYDVDSLHRNPFKTIVLLNRYVRLFNWDWDENPDFPDLGFYNIFYWQNPKFTCAQHIAILGPILRSIGIPVAEVFTPRWRDMDLGHSWLATPDSAGKLTLFSAIYQNPGTEYKYHSPNRATKLYMRTFEAQKETPFYLKAKNELLPVVFGSPCMKDVTSSFVQTRDIEIEITQAPDENNLCWFSVFIQGKWVPVSWGVVNREKKKVLFKAIPVGLTGLATFFTSEGNIPCSKLFTVTNEGYSEIRPTTETCNISVTRKYPEKMLLQEFVEQIIGTKLEGANKPDFSDADSITALNQLLIPYYQDVEFINNRKYKYYRLVSPIWQLHIAEIEFLTEQKIPDSGKASELPVFSPEKKKLKQYYKFRGKIIGASPDSSAFDGNILTWCNYKWTGMEFVVPQRINRIRVAPRNANNGIVPGDTYQLLYWNNGWIEAGIQKAAYNFIEFRDVPSNTLYWLRNLDHGKEEQPFFYRDGKQVFSNQ